MSKIDHLALFLTGVGIGATAAIMMAPEAGIRTRRRLGCLASDTSDALNEYTANLGDELNERTRSMSDLKDKAKQRVDGAADAVIRATRQATESVKEAAHWTGKMMEEGGKRLQDA